MNPFLEDPRYRTTVRLGLFALQVGGLLVVESNALPPTIAIVAGCTALFSLSAIMFGIGRMRLSTLAPWAAICVPLTSWIVLYNSENQNWGFGPAAFVDLLASIVESGVVVFVCHVFVAAADADRRLIATYPTYVNQAWTLATELLLVGTGIFMFWAVAFGGLWLFSIDAPKLFLVTEVLFPLSGLVAIAVLDLLDRRPAALKAARSFLLASLSWALPVAILILFGNLVWTAIAQPKRLWDIDENSSTLFLAALVLVVFINAAFRDGGRQGDRLSSLFLVHARFAAVFFLVVAVALYAGIEVGAYFEKGWTPYGITNVAIAVILGAYGLGYFGTALATGTALRGLPATNIVTALAGIALFLASNTPLLDSNRLAVDYQLKRLASGQIAPDKFDYDMLFFDAGPYGREALQGLAQTPGDQNTNEIARRAGETLESAALRRRNKRMEGHGRDGS
ncbi:MAG: hypothetical protein JSR24_20075 [Proteobacteria bacterium]|nr:hypothetical protein [Pseudomonadota bacterium]